MAAHLHTEPPALPGDRSRPRWHRGIVRGFRHIPVVDAADRLVGIVTRAELIAVLHRARLADGSSDASAD